MEYQDKEIEKLEKEIKELRKAYQKSYDGLIQNLNEASESFNKVINEFRDLQPKFVKIAKQHNELLKFMEDFIEAK